MLEWLKFVVCIEYYIKIGLVILGVEILFSCIVEFGFYGLVIVWGVMLIVVIFMYLFGICILKM